MTMQTQIETREVGYPCLKQYTDEQGSFVVLFSDYETGTVVHVDDRWTAWEVGHHSTEWAEDSFDPFNATVTLANS
jgi:hypothetical protein